MNNIVGKPMDRVDGRAKVTGTAKYAGDFTQKDLAHAVIFESTIARGAIQSFDLEAARKVPGVIEILTHENAPKLKKPKSESAGGSLGEESLPLADSNVRYNGQFIGAVIAESLEAAQEGARLVKVKYKEQSAAIGLDEHRSEAYVLAKMQGMGEINGERGSFKKAYAQAPSQVGQTYRTPIENHNPMEPSATLAVWENGDLTIYDATQGVATTADIVKQAAQAKNMRVIAKFIGGGFGCKGSVWNHQLIAVMAAMKTKRPVKLVLTRMQMFTGVGHRAETIQEVALGAQKDGKLDAISHVVTNNTAVDKDYSERSGVATRMLYACENLDVVHKLVKLNLQTPTFMRAPGEASGSVALECALDELAAQLKVDPIELRLKNYAETDPQSKKPYSSKSLRECYRQGAEKFGWSRRPTEPRTRREGQEWVGYGMATATYPANRFAATATVEIDDGGRAKVRSATQDIGTGSYTIFTQVAADGLGLPVEKIDLDIGDSQFPKAGVSGGSTTASSVGSALKKACDDLRAQLIALAVADDKSPLHKVDPKDVSFADGRLFVSANAKRGETYAELLRRNGRKSLLAKGEIGSSRDESGPYATHAFGAQFAEVRVHALTGEVRVAKMTGAFACGKILNPKTTESQFMGGMIFGLGACLMEETVPDRRSGRLVVKDLADYHVPVAADVPQIDVVMVPEEDPHVNPLGTKGVGEIGIVGIAAAIANAVYNATGVRARELPLTPEKIAAGLGPLVPAKS